VLQRNGLAWLILGLAPSIIGAHGVDAEWKQIDEKISVEAFFDTGGPVREARVQIVDDNKMVIASGVTDADGKCTLRAPNAGKYQLIVDAGAGHRRVWPIAVVGTLPPEVEAPSTKQADVEPPPASSRRAELTRFPWERVAIGCGIIAALGGAWWLTRWNARRIEKPS